MQFMYQIALRTAQNVRREGLKPESDWSKLTEQVGGVGRLCKKELVCNEATRVPGFHAGREPVWGLLGKLVSCSNLPETLADGENLFRHICQATNGFRPWLKQLNSRDRCPQLGE